MGFNLSEWALRHQPLVRFLIVLLALVGVLSYQKLGQSEDPPFTFKVMVVRTEWPGASAREMEEQVTDRIEKKLQEVPNVDYLRSYSRPGESVVLFVAKDSTPAKDVPDIFYQVRKKIGDIRGTLPTTIRGPYFNDEFGDVFGNIYALTGDGFDYAQLKAETDKIRAELLRVPSVAKVDLIGEQEQRIYVALSNARLATLGLDVQTVTTALAQQNAVVPGGYFETKDERIYLRPSGAFDTVEAIRDMTIRAGGRELRIGDIATVRRGFVEPPAPGFRFQGQDALGLGVSMAKGGDIIALGANLKETTARIQANLPVGMELKEVASQPEAVQRSISEFVHSLAEAVIIVLVVCFFSLGLRTGLVVALSIPLVLAVTFFGMRLFDVGLHKISLGALILALGLLVDDAIIAVEMMLVKMEQGWERSKAAAFAYTSTAGPMLSGTLVTVAGFLPIATAQSSTGEYTRSIFQVNAIALLASWLAAVIVVPYLGYVLLPDPRGPKKPSWFSKRFPRLDAFKDRIGLGDPHIEGDEDSVFRTPFYNRFRAVVDWCVARRWVVIGTTLAIFATAIVGFGMVQQQFFPNSTRLELLIDLRLPEGASLRATKAEVEKLETVLKNEKGIHNYVAYVGTGSPRFYLPLDQQLPAANFAQFVVLTDSIASREALRERMIALFRKEFPNLRANVTRLENGPPVGFPVQFRVSGPDIPTVRKYAAEVAGVMRGNPNLSDVQLDWDEQSKVLRVEVDQRKARLLGLTTQDVANFLNSSQRGLVATSYREGIESIDVVLRGDAFERDKLSLVAELAIPTRAGKSVPLTQVATVGYAYEQGLVWRRNREPSITVRGQIYVNGVQAPTVTAQVAPQLEPIRARLPAGYRIETGGAVEESAKGQSSVNAGFPLFLGVVFTVLMVQLGSFSRTTMVVLTAPLGLIGVVLFLLLFNQPFGFVAMLGTIALFGMIMRNSVILVDQIEQDVEKGLSIWNAIVESAVRRLRPIALTAAAAVLAMIPLTRSAFFGPMAVAIMGGLIVATLLTLLFVPALYAAWYRVRREPDELRGAQVS
ncbi:resistance-nodulation-cell division efflux transporter [Zoogloea oryzae]|uniref:Resistance-nodulation-cell division efflux transporter n=1 Tax=Zoogloea oryzae TaxID=310767 RepID=A0ABQ6FDR4_9RHOO|nr:efflux RND transporter permease subunit [Zoogloea oryzae]GLT23758.1 resistance-nodulation-cell division efflux transporter [Zoogloea oryzae]